MPNPFNPGNPVSPDLFIGREEEVMQIVGRLKAYGQSTLLSGDLCVGKTSLLLYLMDKNVHGKLFVDEKEDYVFSFVDAQTLDDELKPIQFWGNLLQSVEEFKQNETLSKAINEMLEETRKDPFSINRFVRNLIKKIGDEDMRFVLIIDELDSFLEHPHFSKVGFLGNLRSLATNSNGVLAIIAASCFSLSQLNKMSYGDSTFGSPFFNFMNQLTLGTFASADVEVLLERANKAFDQEAVDFIVDLSGGHPLLSQAIAYELWYEYKKDPAIRKDPVVLGHEIRLSIKDRISLFMEDNWRRWTNYKIRAIVYIAAIQSLPTNNQDEKLIEKYREELTRLKPEVTELENQGYICEDIDNGVYFIPSQIILEWVIEKGNDFYN
jgi:hypothetical protein